MSAGISRRSMLAGAGAAVAAGLAGPHGTAQVRADEATKKLGFKLCLNTSTLRECTGIKGDPKRIEKLVDIAGAAGYDCIEPWIGELDAYVKAGGDMLDLNKRIRDKGLTVPDAIGFPEWIVDDDTKRDRGMDEVKRCMELVQKIGCERLACPPVGATNIKGLDLYKAAERYRHVLQVGDIVGVTAQVELWGFSTTLGRLSETAFVAVESGHPKACVLADVYHLFKGGSGFDTLHAMSKMSLQMFHMNDYPEMTREKISDKDRIFPGDGVAPLVPMLKNLRAIGFDGALSLELFNPDYWKQDALDVAKTGLAKMKAVVEKAGK